MRENLGWLGLPAAAAGAGQQQIGTGATRHSTAQHSKAKHKHSMARHSKLGHSAASDGSGGREGAYPQREALDAHVVRGGRAADQDCGRGMQGAGPQPVGVPTAAVF